MERVHTYQPESVTQFDPNGFSTSQKIRSEVVDHRSKVSAPTAFTSNELLRSLPRDLFQKLRPSLRSVYLRDEQFLYMQDDRLEYVYFPETAVVSELRTLDDGRTVEITLTGREGAVGFVPLICSSRVANCTQVSQAGFRGKDREFGLGETDASKSESCAFAAAAYRSIYSTNITTVDLQHVPLGEGKVLYLASPCAGPKRPQDVETDA
jgi:hypothetical protein